MSWRVNTQAWSGPFDLLLELVSTQKVDIGAISVSEVADQYLAEVSRMGDLDLDVASDFVLVASTLLDIKASSLVSSGGSVRAAQSDEDLDDDDELAGLTPDEAREVLVERLIAYKQIRNAAAALGSRLEAESRMFPRTAGPDPEFLNLMPDYLEGVTLRGLAVICADLDSRRDALLLEAEHVAPRREPVALTTVSVDRLLRSRGTAHFSELVGERREPEDVVTNLLAVLELYKRDMLTMSQEEAFGDIVMEHVDGAPAYVPEEADLEEWDAEWVVSDEADETAGADGAGGDEAADSDADGAAAGAASDADGAGAAGSNEEGVHE